ncbi:MAG TPA: ATP-binding protein [Candidatus Binatus sp.]|nr:ATP-binding protein [Candidatus Binatus sp.]
MALRRMAGGRRRREEPENPLRADRLLATLVRALDLAHAALSLEDGTGADVAVAAHGQTMGAATVTLPIRSQGRTIGRLLLEPNAGTPLTGADQELAEALAATVSQLVESRRLAADLERTRQLLARADQLSALGTLSASVAHEIRNPLVSVRTFIQLVPERIADEEFRTGFRDLALGEIERICALINDLLAFARPPAQREPTDLNELAAQIIRLLDAEARRRDIAVSCRADETLPRVVVDDAQVKQVLMNVILNAVEACGPHGTVEVVTRTEESRGERWCAVIVADSGSGIAPEHVEQIFDPFFTTKNGGSGLGLFIAHQIVDEHGGYITTAARPEGGTEFAIHFPPADQVADVDAV